MFASPPAGKVIVLDNNLLVSILVVHNTNGAYALPDDGVVN